MGKKADFAILEIHFYKLVLIYNNPLDMKLTELF